MVLVPKVERLDIPKDAILDGSNYTDWKMVVLSVLEQQGLKETLVDGALGDIGQLSSAKTFLLFSMNREHRNKINHCNTANEIWLAIANIYENKSKRAINTLWKRLFNFKIESPTNVSQGISEMQTIVSSLRTRGIKVDDSCLVGCIECALPEEFNDWIINWSMRESKPTLNELITSINNHVETLKTTKTKAMVAASKNVYRQQDQPMINPRNCNYCKKPGHEIAECRKLKPKREEQAKSKPFELAMMALTSKVEESIWLADSGCSLHMTNNKAWISNYRSLVTPINIRLGENRIIQALGFGEIKTSIGAIKNVHFVPQIMSNLFSLSSATDHGIHILTDKFSMRFIKDNQEVSRGKIIGKTYQLRFDIMWPEQTTCAAATLEEKAPKIRPYLIRYSQADGIIRDSQRPRDRGKFKHEL